MKISIITINYNNEIGLEQTITSVLRSKNEEIEYLVIDGNSSDNSKSIIEKYADKIDYWVSEPDKGIFNAMNKGINKASGEYLLFLNSGDILIPDLNINNVLSHLNNSEDIIFFNIIISDRETSYIKTYSDTIDFLFFVENALPHQASFIKRKRLLECNGYNETLRIASDWTFFIDMICTKRCTYKYVNEHFSIFYTDGISNDDSQIEKSMQERNEHIKKYYQPYLSTIDILKEYQLTKKELSKLKWSRSVRTLKKIGCLRWLDY